MRLLAAALLGLSARAGAQAGATALAILSGTRVDAQPSSGLALLHQLAAAPPKEQPACPKSATPLCTLVVRDAVVGSVRHRLVVLTLMPGRARFRIRRTPKEIVRASPRWPLSRVFEHVTQAGDVAVVTGGMYRWPASMPMPKPAGLLVRASRVDPDTVALLPSVGTTAIGGVLLQVGPTIRLLRFYEYSPDLRPTYAFRSHPILVWDGVNDRVVDRSDHHARLAIGEREDGALAVVLAYRDDLFAPDITIKDWADFLAGSDLGTPGFRWALNLDGSVNAHLHVPALGTNGHFGPPSKPGDEPLILTTLHLRVGSP